MGILGLEGGKRQRERENKKAGLKGKPMEACLYHSNITTDTVLE